MNILRKMQNKFFTIRICVLAAGIIFYILPQFTKEIEFFYVLSPWIYLACFLYYTRTIERKRDWMIFLAAMLVGSEVRFRFFLGDYDLEIRIIAILLLIIVAAGFMIPFICDKLYAASGGGTLAIVMFPLIRLLIEDVLYGQQFNLSLSQFGNKWLIQSEALFGDRFISFMVALIPSVITYMIVKKNKTAFIRGGISLLLCALIFAHGIFRYNHSRSFDKTIKMAYASGPQKTYYEDPAKEDPSYQENAEYLRRTVKEAAEGGARLIAYAEEAFMTEGRDENDGLVEEAMHAAQVNNICILLCLDYLGESYFAENTAVLIDQNGNYLSHYTKTNLIPVIETGTYEAGDGIIPCNHITIDGQDLAISYTICYDATFSDFLLTMDSETNLYINPSWDWSEIVDLNYRMQGISAIQGGVVLFKPTVDGWSTVMDPYGRLHYKESTLRGDYNKVYFVDVPYGKANSLYKKWHKQIELIWSVLTTIALLNLAYICVIRIAGWVKNRRKKINSSNEK